MADVTYAILALLPLVAWYIYASLRTWRFEKYSHIPQQFPSSLALGHLKLLADGFKKFGGSRHVDYVFEDLHREIGSPQTIFVDLRPVNYPMVVIASHDIAEQVSRPTKMHPQSVLKSATVQWAFRRLIGKKSIVTEHGESWKALRKSFNPGFAPQHLITLLPKILEKTSIFTSKLDSLARSGDVAEMEPLCTNLTFDIIGEVILNVDFMAQDDASGGADIVRHFRTLINSYIDIGGVWLWLHVPKRVARFWASVKTDAAIKRSIKAQFAEIKASQSASTKETKDRSVVALALKDTDVLTSEQLQIAADQVKSFLFAGHDTTSTLLQRLFYALSIHPKALATIRAEHDAVFGDADPQDVLLERPDETIKALSYTSACIKEALRLWPPAGSARRSEHGTGFKIRMEDGQEFCLDGCVLYICHYLIQRDRKVYGDTAADFIPERWLGDTDTSAANKDGAGSEAGASKIPHGAWRAFERGPRNCIGQELANLEARVILACVIRRYDFIKVGAGEVELDEKGNPVADARGAYKTKSQLHNAAVITAKPFDKCQMRVKLH